MDATARRALVSGTVQGVAFRHHAKLRARELGLGGWVRNLPDGRVEAWIEGPEEIVESMLAWLRRGPPGARVEGLEVEGAEPAGHDHFRVRLD